MASLWSEFWGTAVLLPLSFLVSTIFNTRRTEDSSYALWSTLLLRLCSLELNIFILCPQYGLYVTPSEPSSLDPDTSISSSRTQFDNQARGVFVDNCLILPEVEITHRPNTKGNSLIEYLTGFFKTQPFFSETDVRTVSATVPIIVEQKRPPSRHPRDILAYYRQVQELLRQACGQAWGQGHCLFSMPKFGHQEQVMLIAASGGWWCFCLNRRLDVLDRVFNFERFREFNLNILEEDDAVHDDSDLLTTPAKAADSATKKAHTRYEEQRKSSSDAREERMRRRDHLKEEMWKRGNAKERLRKFVEVIGTGPYTLEELDECSRLVRKTEGKEAIPFSHQFDGDLRVDDPQLLIWTAPMRLGTPVSDEYMTFIKKLLADLARKEVSRRNGKGAD